MLSKIFAVVGVLAAIIVIIIGIDVFFVGFDDSPFSKNQEAQKETSLLVTKVNKDENELILLIKIKNNSEKNVFLRGLVVNVVTDHGEIIDKCPASISAMVPSSIPAKTENTIKVLCKNMQLSAKYQGDVQYIAAFEEAF